MSRRCHVRAKTWPKNFFLRVLRLSIVVCFIRNSHSCQKLHHECERLNTTHTSKEPISTAQHSLIFGKAILNKALEPFIVIFLIFTTLNLDRHNHCPSSLSAKFYLKPYKNLDVLLIENLRSFRLSILQLSSPKNLEACESFGKPNTSIFAAIHSS